MHDTAWVGEWVGWFNYSMMEITTPATTLFAPMSLAPPPPHTALGFQCTTQEGGGGLV